MSENIYKTPSSDLGNPSRHNDRQTEIKRRLVIASLASPLVASLAFTFIFFLVTRTMPDYSDTGLLFFGFTFVVISALAFACTLVFVLPLHWGLGKFNRRAFYIYLLFGITLPALGLLIFRIDAELSAWLTVCGTGALCVGMFWYLAVKKLENEIS